MIGLRLESERRSALESSNCCNRTLTTEVIHRVKVQLPSHTAIARNDPICQTQTPPVHPAHPSTYKNNAVDPNDPQEGEHGFTQKVARAAPKGDWDPPRAPKAMRRGLELPSQAPDRFAAPPP